MISRLLQSLACLWLSLAPAHAGFIINPYAFAAAGVAGDPHWASVSLLLHFDGADGSTTFTDQKGKTVTPSGNAQIDTAQSKFGGASGLFDGTGDFLSVAASEDFNFGTGNFTIEWWFRFNTVSGLQYFFDIGSNGTFVRLNNGTSLLVFATGGTVINAGIAAPTVGVWHYMSLVRSGNAFTFRINGMQVATGTDTRAAGSSSAGLRIGDFGGGGFGANGWMDDFRITKGVARDTTTTPTAPFPDS